MNDELIHDLVRDLTPVTRLASPGRRTLYFALPSLLATVLLASRGGVRTDLDAKLTDLTFALETVSLVALFVGAGLAALTSAIPGAAVKYPVRVTILAAGAWLLLLTDEGFIATGIGGHTISVSQQAFLVSGFACVRRTVLLATPPAFLLLAMVRRSAPAHSRLTGALVGLSAAGLAILGTRLACYKDEALHVFAWHAVPVIAFTLGGWALGDRLLTFARR
jgi:hypothetical protein